MNKELKIALLIILTAVMTLIVMFGVRELALTNYLNITNTILGATLAIIIKEVKAYCESQNKLKPPNQSKVTQPLVAPKEQSQSEL